MPRRIARSRGQAQLIFLGTSMVLVLLMGIFLFRSPPTPGAGDILREALGNLEQVDSYRLVILEEMDGKSLFFQGKIDNGILTGELPEYVLEALYEEELLLRRSGEEEWQTAEKMNLQGLAGFLFKPVEILRLQESNFSSAFAGPDITLSDRLYKTIFIELNPGEKMLRDLFPDINLNMVNMIKLGVALTDPGMEIKQLRVIVEFSGDGGDLERTYYLE